MIGFIGCGNMARAIINGLVGNSYTKKENLVASAATETTKDYIVNTLGIGCASSNAEVVEKSDLIFLAVKPQKLESVIEEIRSLDLNGKTFVSMSPGKTLSWFREQFQKAVAVIRTAPNTPLLCGEGMTSICASPLVSPARVDEVREIFGSMGRTALMEEKLMDNAMALSGSSPAFVFMFIEALADGAVAEGMPRSLAYELAAQAVVGSGKMVLTSGKHPGQLKDEVASPAGTTIEGIGVLEEAAFRSAVAEAVRECIARSREL